MCFRKKMLLQFLILLLAALPALTVKAQPARMLSILKKIYPGKTVNYYHNEMISVLDDTTGLYNLFDSAGNQINPQPLFSMNEYEEGIVFATGADKMHGAFYKTGSWMIPFKYNELQIQQLDDTKLIVAKWRQGNNPWGDQYFDCYSINGIQLISNCKGILYKTGGNYIIAQEAISGKKSTRFKVYDFSGALLFETDDYGVMGVPNARGEVWALETPYSKSAIDILDLKGKRIKKYKYKNGTTCPCDAFDPDFLSYQDEKGNYFILRANGQLYATQLQGKILCPENNTVVVEKTTLNEDHGKYYTTRQYGIADLYGKTIVQQKYEGIGPISDGMVAVKLNGFWGYVDTASNEVISFKYSRAAPFLNGTAMVTLNGNSFAINKLGQSKKQCISGDCISGPGSMVENEVFYSGNFSNGQPDGYGRETKNGIEYSGTWLNGKKVGKGYIYIYGNGFNADFEYLDGKPYHVKIELTEGPVFEGNFSEDREYYTGTLLLPTMGSTAINHDSFEDLRRKARNDMISPMLDSRTIRRLNEKLHNSIIEQRAASYAETEAYEYQRIQEQSRRIEEQNRQLEIFRQQRAKEKEEQKIQQSNINTGNTTCSCCSGKGSKLKLVAEFHKTSERRIERPKPKIGGGYIIEVYYEPIGYTTYRQEYEKCNCCGGSGNR